MSQKLTNFAADFEISYEKEVIFDDGDCIRHCCIGRGSERP
jgi:hypothetical protein